MNCALCSHPSQPLYVDTRTGQRYFHCQTCDLRFLHPSDRLTLAEERAHYGRHENDVYDTRYQNSVRPLFDAIRQRVETECSGLDYGAGPGPVVAHMLRNAGYSVEVYDPAFWPDATVLDRQYDFSFACEVVEHFHRPKEEFERLHARLHPQGILAIKTHFFNQNMDFGSWYYRLDRTHVVFYSNETLHWIQKHCGFSRLQVLDERIAILQR